MAKTKNLNIVIKSKAIFLALLGLTIAAFVVSLKGVSEAIAPLLKMEAPTLSYYGDIVFTGGVAATFFFLAFVTMSNPIVALLFAGVGVAVAYHLTKKF